MAEEPGKCRYIMGILEKNKKSKGTAFVYDENNDYYKMEINGIEFVCDSIHSDYEKHAVELAQAYEKRLPDIVDYLMPDIKAGIVCLCRLQVLLYPPESVSVSVTIW